MNGITILTSPRSPHAGSDSTSTSTGTGAVLSPTLRAVDSPVALSSTASTSTATSTSMSTSSIPSSSASSVPTLSHSISGEIKAVSFDLPSLEMDDARSPAFATDPDGDGEISDTELGQLIEALRSNKDRIWLLRVGESMERMFGSGYVLSYPTTDAVRWLMRPV
ncbi:hypothetical protein CALVIDRAFT_532570 [Calocera viscosa TUFC12733]|uniref:EF-hand domain-containing protein n=1 Tax=Calocera viscosa (strain TUFC12733) TaxID=1330018 RepID=A0A167SDI0_CALVF|nr:hypothetical protein CALVIDRAFT_532570 [Calocera viscosa TUFC12733]